jgi:chromosome segregation ATPase
MEMEVDLKTYLDEMKRDINEHTDTQIQSLHHVVTQHIENNKEAHEEMKARINRIEKDVDGAYSRDEHTNKMMNEAIHEFQDVIIRFERTIEKTENQQEHIKGIKASLNQLYEENKRDREFFAEKIERITGDHDRKIDAIGSRIEKTLDDHRSMIDSLREKQTKDDTRAVTVEDKLKALDPIVEKIKRGEGFSEGVNKAWYVAGFLLMALIAVGGYFFGR